MEIVFATQNEHKLAELKKLMPSHIKLLSANDLGVKTEIPETGYTLNQNASQKAWYIYSLYQKNCFADDTGLEVASLNNAPGVYSARYAGEEKDAAKNMSKLLHELNGHTNRQARFRTIIALVINGIEYQFEGVVDGEITHLPKGEKGFGYDPIFIPKDYHQTFAELSIEQKNTISHRAKAVEKLINFLNNPEIIPINL